MLRYLRYKVVDLAPLTLPVIVAVILLYIIVSVITWGGIKSLAYIVQSNEVLYAIKLSLITSLTAVTLSLLTGIPIAYVLSRYDFRGKAVIEALLLIPFAMPPIALGAALLIFFTNTILGAALNSVFRVVFEIPGLIVAQFTIILPMVIRVLKTSFDLVDVRYENVARTLGYSRFMTLIKVVLPMSRTGLLSALVLGFSRALGEFGASVTLAGATRFKTETLPIAIYLTLSSGDVNLTVALIAIAVVIAFISLTFIYVLSKMSRLINGIGGM